MLRQRGTRYGVGRGAVTEGPMTEKEKISVQADGSPDITELVVKPLSKRSSHHSQEPFETWDSQLLRFIVQPALEPHFSSLAGVFQPHSQLSFSNR